MFIGSKRIDNLKTVREPIECFYDDLYSKDIDVRPNFYRLDLSSISQKLSSEIELPLSESKIKRASVELAGKNPQARWVPINQYGWKFMKCDNLRVFEDFHKNGYLDW